ncbi:MAG: OmpA family protein [Verrucomicrobia bacterium]|nr:OmpA family protein [Verrucomicrobiota bacterium]
MKSPLLLLILLSTVQIPLFAQVIVVEPAPAPTRVVIQGARPAARPVDTVVLRGRLSVAPKVVIVTPAPTPAPAPQEIVKTTKTTTVVDTPGRPLRVYNSERSVVVVEDQGQTRELQYVTLPVLFVKSTAELLDTESRAALDQVAGVILEVSKTDPGAQFDIEGHTSTEGTDEFNMSLSAARAQRVYDELTQRYHVPANALSAHGYGENFPAFPDGTEEIAWLEVWTSCCATSSLLQAFHE